MGLARFSFFNVALIVLLMAAVLLVIGPGQAGAIPVGTGKILYAVTDSGVQWVDSSNGTVIKTVSYPSGSATDFRGAVLSPDGSKLFIKGQFVFGDGSGHSVLLSMDTKTMVIRQELLNGDPQYGEWGYPYDRTDYAVSADSSRLFMVTAGPSQSNPNHDDMVGTLRVYDRVNGEYSLDREIVLGGLPHNVVATPDGSRVYLVYTIPYANQHFNNDVLVAIDLATEQVTEVTLHQCVNDIALSPDGTHLYVAMGMNHPYGTVYEVAGVDLSTYQVKYFTDNVCYPTDVEVSPDGQFVYVLGYGRVPDTEGYDVFEEFPAGFNGINLYATVPAQSGSLSISPDGRYAYFTTPAGISQRDIETSADNTLPEMQEVRAIGVSARGLAPSNTVLIYSVGGHATPTPAPTNRRVLNISSISRSTGTVRVSAIPGLTTPTPAPATTIPGNLLWRLNLTQISTRATSTPAPSASLGSSGSPPLLRLNLSAITVRSDTNESTATSTPVAVASPTTSATPSPAAATPSPKPAGDSLMALLISASALLTAVTYFTLRTKR